MVRLLPYLQVRKLNLRSLELVPNINSVSGRVRNKTDLSNSKSTEEKGNLFAKAFEVKKRSFHFH